MQYTFFKRCSLLSRYLFFPSAVALVLIFFSRVRKSHPGKEQEEHSVGILIQTIEQAVWKKADLIGLKKLAIRVQQFEFVIRERG